MSDSYKVYASKDYVDSKGLPEGGAPYQQLVTDGEGNAKWEDRTHYAERGSLVNLPHIDPNVAFDDQTFPDAWTVTQTNMAAWEMTANLVDVATDNLDTDDLYNLVGCVVSIYSNGTVREIRIEESHIYNDGEYLQAGYGSSWVKVTNDGEITLAIEGSANSWRPTYFPMELFAETIKTLDPKYLPENFGGASSWNDLKDKPFSVTETVYVEWDGNTTGLDRVATNMGVTGFYGPFPADFEPWELIGATVYYEDSRGQYSLVITEDHLNDDGTALYVCADTNNRLIVFASEDNQIVTNRLGQTSTYSVPKSGLWMHYSYPTVTKISSTEAEPIADAAIPNSIARINNTPFSLYLSCLDATVGSALSFVSCTGEDVSLALNNKRSISGTLLVDSLSDPNCGIHSLVAIKLASAYVYLTFANGLKVSLSSSKPTAEFIEVPAE